jgi:hypothetical protein
LPRKGATCGGKSTTAPHGDNYGENLSDIQTTRPHGAYRAVEAAGGQVARIEIDKDKIILVPARAGDSDHVTAGSLDDKIAL